jgi:hypothetical protein
VAANRQLKATTLTSFLKLVLNFEVRVRKIEAHNCCTAGTLLPEFFRRDSQSCLGRVHSSGTLVYQDLTVN